MHAFAFRAVGSGIRADFRVIKEEVQLTTLDDNLELFEDYPRDSFSIIRGDDGAVGLVGSDQSAMRQLFRRLELLADSEESFKLSPQELVITSPLIANPLIRAVARTVGAMSVFRMSADLARLPGVPTPNPVLSSTGQLCPRWWTG